jgi:hypothetical protein
MHRMLRWIGLVLALLVILHAANLAMLHWRHYRTFGHFALFGVHANVDYQGTQDVVLHAVEIANFALLPRRIRVCHALTDINEPISFVDFIVEEWNVKHKHWRPHPGFNWDNFCKGIPTSHGDGEIRGDWLLPGQSLRQEIGVPLPHAEKDQHSIFRLRLLIDPGNPESGAIFTSSFPAVIESPAKRSWPAP